MTERGGSVVMYENRIGRSRVQIPWPVNLVVVFSGFPNLEICEELVIFQRQMSGWSPYSTIIDTTFKVYCCLRSETIVVKMANF